MTDHSLANSAAAGGFAQSPPPGATPPFQETPPCPPPLRSETIGHYKNDKAVPALVLGEEAALSLAPAALHPGPPTLPIRSEKPPGFFKTLDRIVSDILYTVPYVLSHERSLLELLPETYSAFLASIAGQNLTLHVLNNALVEAPKRDELLLDPSVQILRGILARPSSETVYHLKALYTTPDKLKLCAKHAFYTQSKESLSQEFRRKVCWEAEECTETDATLVAEGAHVLSKEAVTRAQPVLLDEGNYCCTSCGAFLRVEISGAELTHAFSALDGRSLLVEPIEPQGPVEAQESTERLTQLHTLYKVLKGPLLQSPSSSPKSIPLTHALLHAHLSLPFLHTSLFFTETAGELHPPSLHAHPPANHQILRELYVRKMHEVLFLGHLQPHAGPFFGALAYSTNNATLFALLNERDFSKAVSLQHEPLNLSVNFINLSVATHYDEHRVVECHRRTLPHGNALVYYDNLVEIAQQQFPHSAVVRRYLAGLAGAGAVGMKAYTEAARLLGLDVTLEVADETVLMLYEAAVLLDPAGYYRLSEALGTVNRVRQSPRLLAFMAREVPPYEVALTNLGYAPTTDDEFILNTCLMEAEALADGERSVLSLVLHRRNPKLLHFVENNYEQLMLRLPSLTLAEALAALDLTSPDAAPAEVLACFERQLRGIERTFRYLVLRRALYVIQSVSGSQFLLNYLETGRADTSLIPPLGTWPRGLDNIGNTCYLNSLLQYFFTLRPLREAVLTFRAFDVADPALQHTLRTRKVGNRNISNRETFRAFQFMYHLRGLYLLMIQSPLRSVGVEKGLACLALAGSFEEIRFGPPVAEITVNSGTSETPSGVLSTESTSTPESLIVDTALSVAGLGTLPAKVKPSPFNPFRKPAGSLAKGASDSPPDLGEANTLDALDVTMVDVDVAMADRVEDGDGDEDVAEDVADDVAEAGAGVGAVSDDVTEGMAEDVAGVESLGASSVPLTVLINDFDSQVGRQQDVGEVIDNVVFWTQCALQPETLGPDGYQYDVVTRLFDGRYKNTATNKVERLQYLTVNVVGYLPRDLYDALQNLMDEESWVVESLPEVLQIQVARVYYDNGVQKSSAQLPFYEHVNMDRYMETTDESLVAEKQRVREWKHRLDGLKTRQDTLRARGPSGLTPLEALNHAMEWIRESNDHVEVVAALQRKVQALEAEETQNEIEMQKLWANVDSLFVDHTKHGYTLFAVFIHRGGASYGHYWIYIRDLVRGIWRKYSDDRVEEVSQAEVLNFALENTATANLVVYVRDDLSGSYIDPVKRQSASGPLDVDGHPHTLP